MSDRYTTADLFEELDGRRFSSNVEFESAVIELFNDHRRDFPAGYGHREAIEQADQNGWLRIEDDTLVIEASRAPA